MESVPTKQKTWFSVRHFLPSSLIKSRRNANVCDKETFFFEIFLFDVKTQLFGLIRKFLFRYFFMFLFYLLFKQINIEVYTLASGGPKMQTECMQCCWLNLYPLKILGLIPFGPRTTANISLSLSLALSDYNLD